jgi:hypothetical protein
MPYVEERLQVPDVVRIMPYFEERLQVLCIQVSLYENLQGHVTECIFSKLNRQIGNRNR